MIQFFETYFLLLLFASLAILGWYRITREGMIFQFWSKFWEGKNGTKKKNYEGEKLYKEYRFIEEAAIKVGYKGTIKYFEKYLETEQEFEQYKDKIEHELLIHINTIEQENKMIVQVYEEELIFRFPEKLRSPISACPTCMSSIYGSIIFWTIFALSRYDFYSWSNHGAIAVIFTWICFEFSLAALNTFLHSKIQ